MTRSLFILAHLQQLHHYIIHFIKKCDTFVPKSLQFWDRSTYLQKILDKFLLIIATLCFIPLHCKISYLITIHRIPNYPTLVTIFIWKLPPIVNFMLSIYKTGRIILQAHEKPPTKYSSKYNLRSIFIPNVEWEKENNDFFSRNFVSLVLHRNSRNNH